MTRLLLSFSKVFENLPVRKGDKVLLIAKDATLCKNFQAAAISLSADPVILSQPDAVLPFNEEMFDAIFCVDILESTIQNPCRFFYELASCLRLNGFLFLATENGWFQFLNSFQKSNPNHRSYVMNGHDSQTFAMEEIGTLAQETDLLIHRLWTENLLQENFPLHSRLTEFANFFHSIWNLPRESLLGDHILLLAQRRDSIRYPRLRDSSQKTEPVLDIVKPYIKMCENDHVQLGKGWHVLEGPPFFRWSKSEAEIFLLANGESWLCLSILGKRGSKAEAEIEGIRHDFQLKEGWQDIWFPAPARKGILKIALRTTGWFPSKEDLTEDPRELGLAIKEARLSREKEKEEKKSADENSKTGSVPMFHLKIARNSATPWGKSGSEIILGKPIDGKFVVLDEAGCWIWEKIEKPEPLHLLIEMYVAEKEVSHQRAADAVLRKIGELMNQGFLHFLPNQE